MRGGAPPESPPFLDPEHEGVLVTDPVGIIRCNWWNGIVERANTPQWQTGFAFELFPLRPATGKRAKQKAPPMPECRNGSNLSIEGLWRIVYYTAESRTSRIVSGLLNCAKADVNVGPPNG